MAIAHGRWQFSRLRWLGLRFAHRSKTALINTGMAFNHAAAQGARNGTTASASSTSALDAPPADDAPPPQVRQSAGVVDANQAVTDLTVASVCELIENFVDVLARRHLATFPGLIAVTGRIDSLPPATKYPWHYDVVIAGRGATFHLELPKSEVEAKGITKGSHVRVIGRIVLKTWQGSIKPRLVATQIDAIDAPEISAQRSGDLATLAKVHELRKIRHAFPIKERLKVAVICARSSQVLDDLRINLKEAAANIQIEAIHVSFANEAEIAQAISAAKADILAVIRGGGPESDFVVFDSDVILSALAASTAYRIVALGHSQHQTMCDLVADYSATTPTAAGQFIREQMQALLARLLLQRRMIEAEFERARLSTREPEPTPYLSEQRVEQRPMPSRRPQRPKKNGAFLFLLAIGAVVLLAYAMGRMFR